MNVYIRFTLYAIAMETASIKFSLNLLIENTEEGFLTFPLPKQTLFIKLFIFYFFSLSNCKIQKLGSKYLLTFYVQTN